jgi:putative acetyltransferase
VIEVRRTAPGDAAFVRLLGLLDRELWKRYPDRQQAHARHNILEAGARTVVAYCGTEPVGCGCFRAAPEAGTVEIKRMYVVEESRRTGVGTALLHELEQWAVELGSRRAILETGKGQPEAIGLYAGCGYRPIERYGPYANSTESVCLGKELRRVE